MTPEQELELLKLQEEEYQSKKVSGVESFLRGAGQAATFGFADEAQAGIQAALDPEKEYKDYIAPIRKEYEIAEKANPKSSIAGSLAGTFVPGIGIAGAVGKAAKGAGALARGAELLQGTKTGIAALGATEGALAGYGTSENGADPWKVGGGAVVGAGGALLGNYLGQKLAARGAKEAIASEGDDLASGSKMVDNAKEVFGHEPREDAEQVASAWKSLTGEEAPPQALTSNPKTRELWSDVSKSTTKAGSLERESLDKAYKGIGSAAGDIQSVGGNVTSEEAGSQIRKILSDAFESKMSPIEEGYQSLEGVFDNLPVSKPQVKGMLTRLDDEFARLDPSGKSKAMIENIRSTLENVEDISDLRQFRTNLRKNYKWGDLTDNEKGVLKGIYDNITKVRNNSISRQVAATKGTEFEQEINAGHLKKLLQLDNEYAKTLNDFSQTLGIDPKKGMSLKGQIKEYLGDSTPLEQYMKDLFDKGDIARLKSIQKTNPELFEVMRKRSLSEGVERATNKLTGQATPQGIIGQVGSMKRPEVRDLILGDLKPKFDNARIVQGALPPNFNPSDTATKSMEYGNLLTPNPMKWASELGRQSQYAGKRAILRNEPVNAVKSIVLDPEQTIRKLKSIPSATTSRFADALSQALQRGQSSYAATYFLMQQSEPEFRKALDDEQGSSN